MLTLPNRISSELATKNQISNFKNKYKWQSSSFSEMIMELYFRSFNKFHFFDPLDLVSLK